MDLSTQEAYIQKKLLYKFDKSIDLVVQEYFQFVFGNETDATPLPVNQLLQEIQALEFINFKYEAALLSSNKDLIKNEENLEK